MTSGSCIRTVIQSIAVVCRLFDSVAQPVKEHADYRLLRLLLSTVATCLRLQESMKLHCMALWLGIYNRFCLSAIPEQTSSGPTSDAGWSLRWTGIWLKA